MIEYSQFSGDDSHVKTLQQALTSNYGDKHDFIMSYRDGQTGNDDQAFWALAVMSALETQFPDSETAPASYLEVAVNSFNNIVGRWDTTSCDGGLKWQIYEKNAYGYNYKNSISNGCTFALGARLARYTGNQTYADWAEKIYDWTKSVGLIGDKYEVFDGTDDKTNCAKVADPTQWSYNNAMFLHGSAFMYDITNGASVWKDRVSGFLSNAEQMFFSPVVNNIKYDNIMYESPCERNARCNLDQQSFKAYLARFMAKTAAVAPFTKDTITKYLTASAVGAAKSCDGNGKATCGSKWYTGEWDKTSGVGQQLAALEVTQALLSLMQNIVPVKQGAAEPNPTATATPEPSSTLTDSAPTDSAPTDSAPADSTLTDSAPTDSAPTDSAPIVSITLSTKQAAPTSPIADESIPSTAAPTEKPSSQAGESKTSVGASASCAKNKTIRVTISKATASTSCTPSATTTVYVPPVTAVPEVPSVSTTDAPAAPPVMTTLSPVAPPANAGVPANGSVPSPSAPPEFLGAASSVQVMGSSILGAIAVAMVAGLL
jgi:mannan endo-1,6-alpha-mannosidase